nr:hypothetical protein [Tanacetum cinerariifolium]
MSPTPDLSFTGLDEFVNKLVVKNCKAMSSEKEPKGNPQIDLQDQRVINSGCSRHMTWNMSYLTEYEEIDGGYISFGGNPKGEKITRKVTIKTGNLDFENVYFVKELMFNLFSVSRMCDKQNSVLFNDTEYIVLSPNFKLIDESQVLLRVFRKKNMYSVDLKHIVPKGGLICLFAKATSDESKLWHRRLSHLNFKTMNKLVKGNIHRASCKPKTENLISLPLNLLHMDLFGPTFVKSFMKKMYYLVVTDDYSRFTYVFFLATKDETSGILKYFVTKIENLVDHKVKVIKCDNGTKFKNREMNQFCEMKGILRQFSIARTPQQNGVAERRNRILIKAARTMLADSKTPTLHFMRTFGCPVTILNTIDHLGKFDGKANEGFFIGYSLNSKAFRVFNSRTRIVEENLHIMFSENTPNVLGTQSNGFVGTKASDNADPKSSNDDRSKPSCDDGKKVDKDLRNESEYVSTFNFSSADEDDSAMSDMNNLDTTIQVSPIPTTRIHKDHPLNQVIGDLQLATQTRRMSKNLEEHRKRVISTKWVFKNKKDEMGIVIRNKARLVVQGYTQEERIDYDEVFALVARIKAIKLFLAYASFKDFVVYQMDVKSVILYKKIEEEVYVCQLPGFKDSDLPDRVYKVLKHCIDYIKLLELGMKHCQHIYWTMDLKEGKLTRPYSSKGTKGDILIVQVYVDYIIFGSTKELCNAFERLMHEKFHMSSMGELTFFLGLQVNQKKDGIFICQDKYVVKNLKKFRFTKVKTASTPMETQKLMLKDEDGKEVDVHMYRSMIGSLMYLTSSRPDIMFAVCACARYQVNPKVSHLYDVKMILRKPKRKDTQVPQPSGPTEFVADEVVHKELGDSLVRAATTASSLEAKLDSGAKKPWRILLLKLARVESSNNEESLGEDASKQERRIDDIDVDEDITLVNDANNEMFDVDDLGGEEVFVAEQEVVSTATKTKTITPKEISLTQALKALKTSKPKDKGIVFQEPELVKVKEKRAREELIQESTKKQKVEDDKEKAELKQLMETIPNEEEVAIHDIPLAVKEDLEDLYKLVKARYRSTRPVKSMDYFSWSDMKTMFELHVEDRVWKRQQGYKVLEWKLYDSCGVYSLMMQSMQIYLLVEKKFPLTPPTLLMMLEKKIQIDYESKMAYQLCKLIKK